MFELGTLTWNLHLTPYLEPFDLELFCWKPLLGTCTWNLLDTFHVQALHWELYLKPFVETFVWNLHLEPSGTLWLVQGCMPQNTPKPNAWIGSKPKLSSCCGRKSEEMARKLTPVLANNIEKPTQSKWLRIEKPNSQKCDATCNHQFVVVHLLNDLDHLAEVPLQLVLLRFKLGWSNWAKRSYAHIFKGRLHNNERAWMFLSFCDGKPDWKMVMIVMQLVVGSSVCHQHKVAQRQSRRSCAAILNYPVDIRSELKILAFCQK